MPIYERGQCLCSFDQFLISPKILTLHYINPKTEKQYKFPLMKARLNRNQRNKEINHGGNMGVLTPNEADKNCTDHTIKAGNLLNIGVADHLVLTETEYYSFKDRGYTAAIIKYTGLRRSSVEKVRHQMGK
jgi:RadC-like JAB domain